MNQWLAIRCFAGVVETGSFTKAAEALQMPKATVSKLVLDLEKHLGARLFQRSTRRVTVTPDGQAYYEGTIRLVRELADFDQSFSDTLTKPHGRIRVDVGAGPGRILLIPALPDFFKRFPDVHLDLSLTDRPSDLIADHIDCVIRGGVPTEMQAAVRPLGWAEWITCAAPSYLETYGTPSHPLELTLNHRLVGYRQGFAGKIAPLRFEKGEEAIDIQSEMTLSVDDGAARAAAGLAGLGVLQTFAYAVRDDIKAGRLVPILQNWTRQRYPFQVLYSENRMQSNRVRVFINWLVEVFPQLLAGHNEPGNR
jgi:DNA-binding transcriptional LysR family regulator